MLTMDVLGWFTWLIVGAVAAWLATAVMRTKIQHGLYFDVLLGILSALLGGAIFTAVTFSANPGFSAFRLIGLFPTSPVFSAWSILVAFIAALALLGVLRLVLDMRTTKLPH
jgi:uncharacterized membrane protein YeaQ/YmgE (transglycosylase-associated protein family)